MKPATLLLFGLLLGSAPAYAQGELAQLRGTDARGQTFDARKYHGQVIALTFASRYTQKEVSRVNDQLASRAGAGDVIVVSVIDFQGIPSVFHGYARRKVAESDQPGRIEHLIDEHSALPATFFTDPRRRVDILVIDRDGTLRGRFVGEKQLGDALHLIDEVKVQRAAM